jgi:hypothetical protein
MFYYSFTIYVWKNFQLLYGDVQYDSKLVILHASRCIDFVTYYRSIIDNRSIMARECRILVCRCLHGFIW